jgi:5-methylcytosine-specific restriction endonuclease McrA
MGYKHSEETKRKIGLKSFGRKHNIGRKRPDLAERNHLLKTGTKHSEETKRKISLASIGKRMGAENPAWKGGITPINKMVRTSREYKIWRRAVFERDNYTCVWCGTHFIKGVTGNVELHADHIKPFALFPELRLALDNGRTLCISCHKTTDTYARGIYPVRNTSSN